MAEVEAVQAVYGDDCQLIDAYPPHLLVHLKPRTAEVSSEQVSQIFSSAVFSRKRASSDLHLIVLVGGCFCGSNSASSVFWIYWKFVASVELLLCWWTLRQSHCTTHFWDGIVFCFFTFCFFFFKIRRPFYSDIINIEHSLNEDYGIRVMYSCSAICVNIHSCRNSKSLRFWSKLMYYASLLCSPFPEPNRMLNLVFCAFYTLHLFALCN